MSVTELCLTLEIPECQAVGHTSVTFPNVFNHYSIEDAMSYFNSFKGKSCSASSMYFLCNILFPKCDPATGRMTYACQDHCNGRYNIPFLLSFFFTFFYLGDGKEEEGNIWAKSNLWSGLKFKSSEMQNGQTFAICAIEVHFCNMKH